MKLIIAGGRDYAAVTNEFGQVVRYDFNDEDSDFILRVLEDLQVTEIVQGGANGADAAAKQLASDVGMQCKEFSADWHEHGKAAGPIRNREMAKYADALITFPGGRGTANMIQTAKSEGLKIIERSEYADS